ncbi:MAG TPA: hypothetical protein DDX39_06750 [Bacteroidales bacterium]|nr:MAG: hypothetical protein A2W98_05830 [Bacteroidetes bacterium GWF2_33_38]HBF88326.1 hypothetical protein [Bacteroidales bacterium]
MNFLKLKLSNTSLLIFYSATVVIISISLSLYVGINTLDESYKDLKFETVIHFNHELDYIEKFILANSDKSESEILTLIYPFFNKITNHPTGEYICLIDNGSELIFHSKLSEKLGVYVGNNIVVNKDGMTFKISEIVNSRKNFVGDYLYTQDEKQLLALRKISSRNWTLGIYRPYSAINKEFKTSRYNIIVSILFICFIILPLSSLILLWLSRKIHKKYLDKQILMIKEINLTNDSLIKSKQQLENSENDFKLLFENMSAAFALHRIITDENNMPIDYVFIKVNRKFEELTGLKREDIINKRVLEVLPKTEKYWIETYGKVALESLNVEFTDYSADIDKYFEVRAYSPYPKHFVTSFYDVSERKKIEIKLNEKNEEYLSANEELNERNIELKKTKEQIEESEQRFRLMFENASIGIALLSLDFIFTRVNKAFCDFIGYSESEFLGKTIKEITEPEILAKNIELQHKLKQGEIPFFQLEKGFIHKNGHVVYGLLNATIIKNQENEPLYFMGSVQDITERKKLELAIIAEKEISQKNEILLNEAQKVAKIGHWELNVAENKLLWSDEVYRIFNLEPQEFNATYESFLDNIHPDDKQKVNEAYTNSLINKTNYEIEHRLLLKTGEIKYVLEKCETVFDFEGNQVRSIGTVQDITERKKAQLDLIFAKEKTEESEAFLLNIFENIPLMIFIKNAEDLKFTHFNKAGEQLLGYNREELIGKNDYDFFPKEQADFFTSKDRAVFNSNDLVIIEEENINTKYGIKILYTKKIAIKDKTGNNKYLLGISEDITEKKKRIEEIEMLSFALNNTSESIFIYLKDKHKFVYVNDRACRSLGYSREELLQMNTFDIDPDITPEMINQIKHKVYSGQTMIFETRHKTKDERIFPVEIGNSLYAFNNQEYTLSIVRDITERKKLELSLVKSEEKFRTLITDMSVGVILHNTKSEILMVNRKAMELLGLSEEQLLGKTPFDPDWNTIHDDGSPFPGETHPINEALRTQKPVRNVTIGVYKPLVKKYVWLLVCAEPQFDTDANMYQVVVTFIDISEQRELEKEKSRLSRIIEDTIDEVFIIEPSTLQVEYANKSVVKNLGYSIDEIIGFKPFDFDPLVDETKIVEIKRDLFDENKKRHVFQTEHKRKDGTIYPVIVNLNLFEEYGKTKILSRAVDISEQQKLEQEKLKLSRIIDSSSNEVYIFNSSTLKIEYANQGAINKLGYTIEEFQCLTVYDIDPNFNYESYEKIGELLSRGQNKLVSFESYHKTKDGTVYPTNVTLQAFEENNQHKTFVIITDITERKKSEETIRKLQERYRLAFDTSSDAISINELDGFCVDINTGFTQLTGFLPEDVIGKTSLEINIWNRLKDRELLLEALKTEGYVKNLESEFRCKDGSLKIGLMSANIIDIDGKSHILSITRDITQRKQIETELKEHTETLETIFNNSPAIMLLLNSKTEVVKINKIGLYFSDLHPDNIIGKQGGEVFSCIAAIGTPNGCGNGEACKTCTIRNSIQSTIDTDKHFTRIEAELIKVKAGEAKKYIIQLSTTIVHLNCEKYVLVTMNDISEQRMLENKVTIATIETETKERERFAQELHDGVGPLLSIIRMYIQWLGKKDAKANKDEVLKKAEETIDLTHATIREISTNLSPHLLENFGLNEAIQTFINRIQETTHIILKYESNFNDRIELVKEHILYRILTESIHNAIKHSHANTVTISIIKVENNLYIKYSDDGIGFDVDKIMKSNFGLGLLNIKKRLDSIHAKIEYRSEPNKGVIFEIVLVINGKL